MRAASIIWGLIIGAAILWIVALFVHIPGVKYKKTSTAAAASTPSSTVNSSAITTSTASLPNDFPSDVPVYQPSTVMLATKSTINSNYTSYEADFTSSSQPSAVVSYYKTQLSANGWRLNNDRVSGSLTLIKASKGVKQVSLAITSLDISASAQTGFELSVIP